MYNDKGIDERTHSSQDCQTGQEGAQKWSPPHEMRYLSQNRYCSKSFPRKNMPRSTIQVFRTSRSLNFDQRPQKTFKSPKQGFDQFSRSAKIMRALNFNAFPITAKKKRISKVLNFDESPSTSSNVSSPGSYAGSPPIPLASDLNLSNCSIQSDNNGLGNSMESMDENQNRTPSHSKPQAKKSLTYDPPKFTPPSTPGLRRELKEKIDSLIETPVVKEHSRFKSQLNTSRNLFLDFQEKVEAGEDILVTPKSLNRPVPESTSAIKKSHKKVFSSSCFPFGPEIAHMYGYDDEFASNFKTNIRNSNGDIAATTYNRTQFFLI